MMDLWVTKVIADGILLNGEVLCQKWTAFANLKRIPENERLDLSSEWLSKFKKWNNLKEFKQHNEAESADLIDPNTMHITSVKRSKAHLTYAFTVNADGSDKKGPFIIRKAHKSSNFSEHIVPEDDLQCITVKNFKPNMTSHIQPLDAGIIHCFKAHYQLSYIQQAIDHYNSDISPARIYDINQLKAMQLADAAWKSVDASTIKHCWQKAGILPDIPLAPVVSVSIFITSLVQDSIADMEKQLKESFDDLQGTGVLQHHNCIDIESLLNPEIENVDVEETTDKDIFDAVMASQNAEEGMDENGLSGDDSVLEPSVRTLQKYIEIMDDPFAQNLESILALFGQKTRLDQANSLQDTQITSYFTSK
ncbi:uncharacterized protein BT62DRAFT_980960 [Guyanagaster necrorhizus]|uniref:HTH CENPB-type domain-containing protein n=1 Tax=Guyanagaster necrorhizus TaxID=856835 RepID=A0A9P8AS59_9AGAR|nr:uncharacterized protein BT62DRAFT_980960 [Guyanagaster necrorhizus MCA 3950]KAG7446073.1 hypothetical protein BT62DRAFT_980960 [Guyanagaster necrorhizus MCA 3950]